MHTVAVLLIQLLQILTYVLVGRALLSWFDPRGNWAISRILADVTDPLIEPIRRVVPPIGGMIDISFIIAIVLINLLQRLLASAMLG